MRAFEQISLSLFLNSSEREKREKKFLSQSIFVVDRTEKKIIVFLRCVSSALLTEMNGAFNRHVTRSSSSSTTSRSKEKIIRELIQFLNNDDLLPVLRSIIHSSKQIKKKKRQGVFPDELLFSSRDVNKPIPFVISTRMCETHEIDVPLFLPTNDADLSLRVQIEFSDIYRKRRRLGPFSSIRLFLVTITMNSLRARAVQQVERRVSPRSTIDSTRLDCSDKTNLPIDSGNPSDQ